MQSTKQSNPMAFRSVVAGKFVRSLINEGFAREPYHLPLSELNGNSFQTLLKSIEMKKGSCGNKKTVIAHGFLNTIFSGTISEA